MATTQKPSGAARATFSLDTSQVDAGLRRLIDQVEPKATAQGLFAAGNELLHDAIYVAPMAPKDVGDLRGSARVTKAEINQGRADVLAGFNIEYAARWHEVSPSKKINWTTTKGASSPGPKYLESKMISLRDKYMRIVGDALLKALTGKGIGGSQPVGGGA